VVRSNARRFARWNEDPRPDSAGPRRGFPSISRLRPVALLLGLAAVAQPARALARDCSMDENTLPCRVDTVLHRLNATLHVLYVAASLLAVLLIAVLCLAIWLYRSNRASRSAAIVDDDE
jgi:hypothetical protein